MKRFGKLESDRRDRHSVERLEDNMEEPLGKWGKVGNGKETLEKQQNFPENERLTN